MTQEHSYHIPIMGLGFTVDTPLKVAQYGIDSVMAIGNDSLLENMRKFYCEKYKLPYEEITNKFEDFKAKRVTSYLNLVNKLAHEKFEEFKNFNAETAEEIKKYFNMLPDTSAIKKEFKELSANLPDLSSIKDWIADNLSFGSIDVNIMTKLDKPNFEGDEQLPVEHNGAHVMLRGFANSTLRSSIIFSAGMNPRLYGYMENFDDFFPNENGDINKKIVLKVSDYRSAFIQGRFLAKKGLWVSEFRIESGLNCGGHAFATDGFLMGPILEEFKEKREELSSSLNDIFVAALKSSERTIPNKVLPIKITAQGGVGTNEEHQFLLDHYEVDSVGWGTPFLLVPEATNVDEETMEKLLVAKEEDLYLSKISPMGVPFNCLKNTSKEQERQRLEDKNRPGSACPREYLKFNTEFTKQPICTASRQYQNLKLKELDGLDLDPVERAERYHKIVEKTCLCTGLSTAAFIKNGFTSKSDGPGVAICPGPNMAYFSKKMTLEEITDHIYGRVKGFVREDRPNMFVKELSIYIDYLKEKVDETQSAITEKQVKYLLAFADNLDKGIAYYDELFDGLKETFSETKTKVLSELNGYKNKLGTISDEIKSLIVTQ